MKHFWNVENFLVLKPCGCALRGKCVLWSFKLHRSSCVSPWLGEDFGVGWSHDWAAMFSNLDFLWLWVGIMMSTNLENYPYFVSFSKTYLLLSFLGLMLYLGLEAGSPTGSPARDSILIPVKVRDVPSRGRWLHPGHGCPSQSDRSHPPSHPHPSPGQRAQREKQQLVEYLRCELVAGPATVGIQRKVFDSKMVATGTQFACQWFFRIKQLEKTWKQCRGVVFRHVLEEKMWSLMIPQTITHIKPQTGGFSK